MVLHALELSGDAPEMGSGAQVHKQNKTVQYKMVYFKTLTVFLLFLLLTC